MVSSPSHTFSWASLNKRLTSTSSTYFRFWLIATLLEWFSWRKENDRSNYFMINLHESMGPSQDRTRDPWICNQTQWLSVRVGLRVRASLVSLGCVLWARHIIPCLELVQPRKKRPDITEESNQTKVSTISSWLFWFLHEYVCLYQLLSIYKADFTGEGSQSVADIPNVRRSDYWRGIRRNYRSSIIHFKG